MLKPEVKTQYFFKVVGFTFEDAYDSAIADDLEHAKRIMANAYSRDVVDRLVLLKEEPITLYDKKPKWVKEIGTLRFAGVNNDDTQWLVGLKPKYPVRPVDLAQKIK